MMLAMLCGVCVCCGEASKISDREKDEIRDILKPYLNVGERERRKMSPKFSEFMENFSNRGILTKETLGAEAFAQMKRALVQSAQLEGYVGTERDFRDVEIFREILVKWQTPEGKALLEWHIVTCTDPEKNLETLKMIVPSAISYIGLSQDPKLLEHIPRIGDNVRRFDDQGLTNKFFSSMGSAKNLKRSGILRKDPEATKSLLDWLQKETENPINDYWEKQAASALKNLAGKK